MTFVLTSEAVCCTFRSKEYLVPFLLRKEGILLLPKSYPLATSLSFPLIMWWMSILYMNDRHNYKWHQNLLLVKIWILQHFCHWSVPHYLLGHVSGEGHLESRDWIVSCFGIGKDSVLRFQLLDHHLVIKNRVAGTRIITLQEIA